MDEIKNQLRTFRRKPIPTMEEIHKQYKLSLTSMGYEDPELKELLYRFWSIRNTSSSIDRLHMDRLFDLKNTDCKE